MGEIPRVHQVDPQPRIGGPVHRVADAGDRRGSRRQEGRGDTSADSIELNDQGELATEVSVEPEDSPPSDASLDIVA